MHFFACLLTIHYPKAQEPLTLAEQPQLRHDLMQVLFPTDGQRQPSLNLLTVALLSADRRQAVLRVTCVEENQDHAFTQMLNYLQEHTHVSLCQRAGKVTAFDMSDSQWTGLGTWVDLQVTPVSPSFRLLFATPVLTTTATVQDPPDALPFPEPLSLLTEAGEQWHRLAGPPIPCSATQIVQATRCVLSNYHLHTTEVLLEGGSVLGYRGWVEYTCLRPRATEIAYLSALARLTFFTGCGYATTSGFGTTRILYEK